jgi:hypothetical protein
MTKIATEICLLVLFAFTGCNLVLLAGREKKIYKIQQKNREQVKRVNLPNIG